MRRITLVLLTVLLFTLLMVSSGAAAPISQLIKHRSEADFANATIENLVWDEAGEVPGFVLASLEKEQGTVISPAIQTAFPFNNVVPSWNVIAPEGTGARIELRASVDGINWTNWYEIAAWRDVPAKAPHKSDASGRVNADTLELYRHYQYIQYRITLAGKEKSPRLTLAALCCADTHQRAPVNDENTTVGRGVTLPVPYRSQRNANPAISHRVCSPTCLAMALEYYGFHFSTDQVAAMAYDRRNGIYGNWPFNTAAAGHLGFEAYVTRFPGFGPVEWEVASGHPVIISIRFGYGELSGAPISRTGGHLILIRGFTREGDVVVNDPAGYGKTTGQVVYKREELRRAWKNGIAYIIHPRN